MIHKASCRISCYAPAILMDAAASLSSLEINVSREVA